MPEEEKRRRRVLVVEDEDNIALALDYIMAREGYDRDRVGSGAGALERFGKPIPIWCCST